MIKFEVLYFGKVDTHLMGKFDKELDMREFLKVIPWEWIIIKKWYNNELNWSLPIENYVKAHIL